jgi:hypothetical protein
MNLIRVLAQPSCLPCLFGAVAGIFNPNPRATGHSRQTAPSHIPITPVHPAAARPPLTPSPPILHPLPCDDLILPSFFFYLFTLPHIYYSGTLRHLLLESIFCFRWLDRERWSTPPPSIRAPLQAIFRYPYNLPRLRLRTQRRLQR